MKRFLFILIALLALAACQTPQPAPAPSATTLPPVVIPTTPTTIPSATTAPTVAPTSAPTTAAAATPTTSPTTAPTATPEPTQAPGAGDVYVDTADGLNLRAEPRSTATLIRTLALDTHLTTIGQPTPRDASGIVWQNVRTDDGQEGWVAAQFLRNTRPEAETPAPSPTPTTSSTPVVTPIAEPGYVYVASTSGLSLRAESSTSSPILMTLANGQRLQTNGLGLGPDDNGITWLNVKTDDGVEGWVSAEFVTEQVPSVAPATPPANVSDAVAEILRLTNQLRQQNGLPAYYLNDGLSQLALEHSQYMAQNGITHVGADGLSARQRIANAGYGAGRATENIYGGQVTVEVAWDYWSTDPPHLDNLLNSFNTVVGIGVFKSGLWTYYTMDFGKPDE